jgi:uncharacterized RDD family membrane protein YckC
LETDTNPGTTAYCVECGQRFTTDEMIRHGDAYVCVTCKPIFLQKLVEGASVVKTQFTYAGFWRRFAASLIDSFILGLFNFSLQIIGLSLGAWVLLLLPTAVAIAYDVILIGKYGATLGKTVCRIEVVTAEGGSVSYMLAFGRYFAKLLSAIILCIGYIMIAFDPEKRGLHDRLCNTRVIIR